MEENEIRYALKGKDRYATIYCKGQWIRIRMVEEVWLPKQQLVAYLQESK